MCVLYFCEFVYIPRLARSLLWIHVNAFATLHAGRVHVLAAVVDAVDGPSVDLLGLDPAPAPSGTTAEKECSWWRSSCGGPGRYQSLVFHGKPLGSVDGWPISDFAVGFDLESWTRGPSAL